MNLLLLDGALQYASVVHDGYLAVQGGLARLCAQVLHRNAQLGISTHPGTLILDLHLYAHVIRYR